MMRWMHPLTRKRWQRFGEMRRARWSLVILSVLYGLSLFSELLCNSQPLWVRFEGKTFWPAFLFYSDRDATGEGSGTGADFKAIMRSERFLRDSANTFVNPLVPFGPTEIVRAEDIHLLDEVQIVMQREQRQALLEISNDWKIAKLSGDAFFQSLETPGGTFSNDWKIQESLRVALEGRLANKPEGEGSWMLTNAAGLVVEAELSAFAVRAHPPRTIRLRLYEHLPRVMKPIVLDVRPGVKLDPLLDKLSVDNRLKIMEAASNRFERVVDGFTYEEGGERFRAIFVREDVRFPFRPVSGHPLGLDASGRDVLARIIYGLRTSLTFGLLLVLVSMMTGTLIGALQGYYGGKMDLAGQRIIEIWDSLPFLYILMLMGSVFGRSFLLLFFCYAIFNWIGISYYMRGEFLRLRKFSFVEAAQCMGLPTRVVLFRHMLPNALVPLITFFPFSLVGAIGTLAALDYLGFGLPPPTPSWGEMLAQAQDNSWAWWLTLYPSLALFFVMLLGVFIGEGLRAAFDPRRFTRWE